MHRRTTFAAFALIAALAAVNGEAPAAPKAKSETVTVGAAMLPAALRTTPGAVFSTGARTFVRQKGVAGAPVGAGHAVTLNVETAPGSNKYRVVAKTKTDAKGASLFRWKVPPGKKAGVYKFYVEYEGAPSRLKSRSVAGGLTVVK